MSTTVLIVDNIRLIYISEREMQSNAMTISRDMALLSEYRLQSTEDSLQTHCKLTAELSHNDVNR